MKIDILTLFPEMFTPLAVSMVGRARENGILDIHITDIRDYSTDKHTKADDYPFGGGVGMVMLPEPAFGALRAVGAAEKRCIYMSPRGKILDMDKIRSLSGEEELVVFCGHYEGVDERIITGWNMEEISIGDYILTGGELVAMVLIDSVARFVPGVLGASESAEEESVYSGLLEYPQYTKPREFEGMCVPEVLLNGNHKLIREWKLRESLRLTKERRPDLLEHFLTEAEGFTKDERKIIEEVCGKKY